MSVLQNFPVKLQAAIKELQQVQQRRKNKRMERRKNFGRGTIKLLNAEDKMVHQAHGKIHLTHFNGNCVLVCEVIFLRCDLILWYQCVNNRIILYLKKNVGDKKFIIDMESDQHVEHFISTLKLPEKPWPKRLHDGNVTSSSADSDSSRSGTGGVDNSFDSANPSELDI